MPDYDDSQASRSGSPAKTADKSAEHEGATAPYQALKSSMHPTVAARQAQTKTGSAEGSHPNLQHFNPSSPPVDHSGGKY